MDPAAESVWGLRLPRVEDYAPLIGDAAVERLLAKAGRLRDRRVVHVNSTYYGGGVAELLSALTLLMNTSGIRTDWRVIQGRPDFFSITKKIHNALQGEAINLSSLKIRIYHEVLLENAARIPLDDSIVVVHDPQPLGLVALYRKTGPWIWRCHLDLSGPQPAPWTFLSQYIRRYDAAVFSLKEYGQDLPIPQFFFMPAINPFSATNRPMTDTDIDRRLAHYRIPTDLPLVVQVSRFDRWKDPAGVVRAFRLARREVDATLVLVGNVATDDPEGQGIFEAMLGCQEERIIVLSCQDTALVNALQRRAAVVLQKSRREGFGLTVAEAMWKGTPVIGGNVGGIRHQIRDGRNGFLVDTVEQAAARIVQVLKDPALRRRMGDAAHRTVRRRFLLPRYLEQYLDLFGAFEVRFSVKPLRTSLISGRDRPGPGTRTCPPPAACPSPPDCPGPRR